MLFDHISNHMYNYYFLSLYGLDGPFTHLLHYLFNMYRKAEMYSAIWPQIYKPHDVINGCYVCNIWIPIKSQKWLKCTQNSHKMPTKTPPRMQMNKTLKCTQRHHKNAHKSTYAQLMHHYNNVTLMCRYLKSCTTRLFSRQLFHGSWRPLLVLCMWSTVYRWIPLTDGQ